MNCQDVQNLLHPYVDGELDLVRTVEIEEHLAGCPACAEQEQSLHSLRASLSAPALRYAAPASLRARVQVAGDEPPITAVREPHVVAREAWLRPVALAAGFLTLIGAAVTLGILMSQATAQTNRIADWVVAGHVRSQQVNHLTDVVSTDRHTVKPWFRDKLDFSPLVPDLSTQGFPLSGGRLDYLADRPVAALVYQHGKHVINVFTWPADSSGEKGVQKISRQGFHIRYWRLAGMNYWVISDLNEEDLDRFDRLFFADAASGQP
jgi:anti-sigma factor RsiW